MLYITTALRRFLFLHVQNSGKHDRGARLCHVHFIAIPSALPRAEEAQSQSHFTWDYIANRKSVISP
jgi:hypothetical protein